MIDDQKYKNNNDKNIDILFKENRALKEKTNQLEFSNSNIISNKEKIIQEINNQS